VSILDWIIVLGYIVGIMVVGARLGSSASGLQGYFLGDSNVPAWAVMLSIVATETSAATFLSVPALAYKVDGNFTYLQLAIGYIVGRIFVAFVLLPLYFRSQILTAYEVLHHRFGGATKTIASILFLITRTLGDGLRLLLAAKVFQELFLLKTATGDAGGPHSTDWAFVFAVGVMGTAAMVYSVLGGMKAVIWTDVLQFCVYLLGAAVSLMALIRFLPGGWHELIDRGMAAGKFRFLDFSTDPTKPYTFWAGLIGGLVVSTATHGADQLMVQRYLSARSLRQAAMALMASGLVVFLQFALFLLIGVALWAFYHDHPPDRLLKPDSEFAYFIVRWLPVGLTGLVVAAIVSASMSSSLNASAAAAVNDLVRPLAPDSDERVLMKWSKWLTAAFGFAQILVALCADELLTDNVVNNALTIASFATGVILGLFILAIVNRRADQTAALTGLLAGLLAVTYARYGGSLVRLLDAQIGAPFLLNFYPRTGTIAWPWYALIGASTVVLVALSASMLRSNRRLDQP
jgi:solute:Na+ symporter, SSS family